MTTNETNDISRRKSLRYITAIGLATVAPALLMAPRGWCTARISTAEQARERHKQRTGMYDAGTFHNPWPTQVTPSYAELIKDRILDKWTHAPDSELPIVHASPADLKMPPETGLRLTWLGHSSVLIELDGYRVLTDPVFIHVFRQLPDRAIILGEPGYFNGHVPDERQGAGWPGEAAEDF